MLISIGAVIGMGKLLVGGDRLTLHLLLGRMILGAGLSTSAGGFLSCSRNCRPATLVVGGSVGDRHPRAVGPRGGSVALHWSCSRTGGQQREQLVVHLEHRAFLSIGFHILLSGAMLPCS
ncbi:hypothetical protein [Burkholderia sp. HI2761]|uniref:hypothetical protein n=1 Tax=unclassified Burkholderia TaxID=2613784 RepID=UPI00359C4AC9